CPNDQVTREQMATFLARALDLPAASYPCGLRDVSSSNVHRHSICAIKKAGITAGCNPPTNDRFCPSEVTTRGQMAAFLTRALELPGCGISNYTDVPDSHPFAREICAVWRAGVSVSYRQPDPVNNRYNNTYGPDAPMLRRDMAVFLDRAVVQAPDTPLKAKVSSAYQRILTDAMNYGFASSISARGGEVQSLVYLYRAADKVKNRPSGFSLKRIRDKIVAGADQIAGLYRENCFSGHGGDGTSTFGCARFNQSASGEDLDGGSNYAIALLEASRLLFEIGGTGNIAKGKEYFRKALYAVAHVNDDHRVTSPCLGWEVDATSSTSYNGMIKWNKSNRWAIANFLVYVIRARWNQHVGGDGASYRANAQQALRCFRDDLRGSSRYRCGGKRCYDSASGPWWTGWHSSYSGTPARIDEDPGHGSATAEIVFAAVYDRWNVMDYYDLQQFARHFEKRRLRSTSENRSDGGVGRMFVIPQYPDSDSYPGSRCAQGSGCTAAASDWESRKTDAWLRIASIYGRNGLRNTIRNLEPSWDRIESGNYVGLRVAAFALFGEVGSPRRLGY
ncbi:MAG TPA: hypothetical protein VKZ63_15325, partial [Kofleriaceae bacterium]|nr:hypothetical protein [Kofleriaceae bacterium]